MADSPQTLSQGDRRLLAGWAADCAERALHIFEARCPGDTRVRDTIARARAYSRGELDTASGIRRRFSSGVPQAEISHPAALAAARAAGQAAAVCHMGAHALGAAAYAVGAVRLAASDTSDTGRREIEWQLAHASPGVRRALLKLPAVGEDRSGPLGPGLFARDPLAVTIRALQAAVRSDGNTVVDRMSPPGLAWINESRRA